VPRHTHSPRSKRRSASKPERGGSGRRQRVAATELDAQVLALREAGTSYSAIARLLELERAVDAHRCFIRALDTHRGEDRRRLIGNEEARLDRLEERIRARDAADATKVAHRLRGVTNLREAIEQ
jgi:DNA-binding transcriptional MerR regulator